MIRMIQKIKPELMPRISARPLPFLQMENIHNFLNAVKELGVKPTNLFQTAELYEGTDMNKVIHTLLSLEKVLNGEDDESIDIEGSNNSINSKNGSKNSKSKHVSTIEIFEQSQRNIQGNGKSPLSAENEEVEQYQLGNGIGRGQFGCVYRALNLVTGQIVAIKRIKIEEQNKKDIDSLMQEVELLQSLSHPCIVSYYGFILNDEYLYIILEFVENGSLANTLKSFGNFPEKLIANYTVKILEGLEYLHAKGVIHCDLKAANVLTTKSGDVKLTDFGVSRRLNVMDEKTSAVVGTPNWMAPEIITLSGIVPQSDLWSLGCTIIELYTGKPPYFDLLPMAALFHIVEDSCPPLPDGISEELEDFLHICFKKEPEERTSATELLEHKWILHNAHHDPRKRVMYNVDKKATNYLSASTLYSPNMQKNIDSTKIKFDCMYKSDGNIKKDTTITNDISSDDESNCNSTESFSRKNCVSEYIQPTMIKQQSVDSIVYKNNLLLRSKTLPLKTNEKVKKNILKEYKYEIKMEEELERRRKLNGNYNFSSDDGWLSGPAGLQMMNEDNNMNNIQTNEFYSPTLRGRTLQIAKYHDRHSMSLPPMDKDSILDKKKNKRKLRGLTQEKDPNKDCVIS